MRNDELVRDYEETGLQKCSDIAAVSGDCVSAMGNITSTICNGITTWKQIGLKTVDQDYLLMY